MHFALRRLYPILDSAILPDDSLKREELLRSLVRDLIAAGVTLLQYRNKQGSEAQILADCAIFREVLSDTGVTERCLLILNDRPDLVAAAAFDGAHIGQEDISPVEARAILGPERILGVSTHNEEQLQQANDSDADYLAIGPVFATTTKQKPHPVVGLEGVRRARALASKPLVAIGGITLANCRSVRDAGADCVAVISSLFGTAHANASPQSIQKTARDFFAELR
ncbi:MAG TPA: thiamine phosphate synthase [Acidisarcina sp.]